MAKRRKHGEGTLFKRSDGRYQASFVASDGKRKYFYAWKSSEALEKMRKAQQEDQKGLLSSGKKMLLRDYLPQWLETVEKPKVRLSSYKQYKSAINRHLVPALGHVMVHKLTVQQVQGLYAQKLEEGLSPNTIHIIHGVLHRALNNAVRWNLISRNVTEAVTLPKAERKEHRTLNQEEANRLITIVSGTRLEALLILALTTAMRKGELLGLRWSDIDLGKQVLQVRRTLNRVAGYGFVVNEPKTKSSKRKIMLTLSAIETLLRHEELQRQEREKAGEKWKDLGLVFCNKHGGYIDPDDILKEFQRALEQAGLPKIRFHDLRHSAATLLLEMSVHPKIVQDLLGHSNIATTMDTYSHVLPSMQQEVVKKMGLVFKPGEESEGKNKD